ncbi:MAG: hypothetical protein LQ351_006259 [Letrouitia transgressa]|nr:MAG: hypothetical protein LQ351_006259 [Letrouitia transgressa]
MLPRASFNVIDYSSVPPPQHPLQSNLELGSPTKPPSYNQSPYSNRRPGTTQRASATGTVTDSSSLPRESGRGQTDAHVDLPERAQPSGSHTVAESYLSTSFESQAEASRTAAHCGHANPQSWTLPTPSNATSDITADVEGAPGADATMEERFAYLMACARRVGFDGFDDLASRYYAMNFDHASVLALDQRMSRHRGLPMLLTELRQRSTQWMPWERRGYEDEILKSAEQLCASECEEFRNDENMMQSQSVVEMTLQDNNEHINGHG